MWYNINPEEILSYEMRQRHQSLFFVSNNFRTFSILDTLGLVFCLVKIVDGFRLFKGLNVIVLCLTESVNLLTTFLGLLFVFNFTMVPLAQSIWGTYFIGYKTFSDASNSVFMIAYSKGNLEFLLDINLVWSLVFMLLYYMIAVYILHAAFHMV